MIAQFLSGQMSNFTCKRHAHMANILRHLSYGRKLMHSDCQPSPDVGSWLANATGVADRYSDQLDAALPDPLAFDDLSGGADG